MQAATQSSMQMIGKFNSSIHPLTPSINNSNSTTATTNSTSSHPPLMIRPSQSRAREREGEINLIHDRKSDSKRYNSITSSRCHVSVNVNVNDIASPSISTRLVWSLVSFTVSLTSSYVHPFVTQLFSQFMSHQIRLQSIFSFLAYNHKWVTVLFNPCCL